MAGWLNYHHLFYFRTIATEGSISRASKTLRLGQPALSAQLKSLEDALGAQLFERQHKRLILTDTGRMALDYANEIFRLGNEMQQVLSERRVPSRLHVAIGALDSVPKHLLELMVQTALAKQRCTVSILEGSGDELVRELLAHRIDLFVANYTPVSTEWSGLYARRIARLPVHLYGANKFKGLKKGFPESLQKQPVVLPTSHSRLRQDLDHYFRTQKINIDLVVETQDTAVQKRLGIVGLGLIPEVPHSVEDLVRAGRLHDLGILKGVWEEIYLVSASRKIENPVAGHLAREFKWGPGRH